MRNELSGTVIRHPRHAGMAGLELIAGLAAAVVGGVIWAAIVFYTGYEVGYVAIGVGLLVGGAVAAVVKNPNVGHGVSAAGLVVIGLLLGKFLIVQWGTQDFAIKDPEIMLEASWYDMIVNDLVDEEAKAWYLDDTATFEDASNDLTIKIEDTTEAAEQALVGMDEDQKKAIAKQYVDYRMGDVSLTDRIKEGLSPWDLLWFGIAIYFAFQVASGKGQAAEE